MARVLIIGGGVAGLSAGIYAQKHGHHAIVCERHFISGGNLTGWNRNGYHIDNCIHWLTGTNPYTKTYKMWEELGALGDGIGIYRGESLYTCDLDGRRLSLCRDIDKLESDMLSISPDDKKEISSFIKAVKAVQGLSGIAGKEHDERLGVMGAVAALPLLVKYYRLTLGELGARFCHPLLRKFFGCFLSESYGAIALVYVAACFCGDNADLPEGGSLAMAKRMESRFLALGGELHLRKEAVKINRGRRGAKSVTFADGTTVEANYIVLTTDPAMTFGKLLDKKMPKSLAMKYSDPRLKRFSSYQCAIACDLPSLPFSDEFVFEVPGRYKDILGSKDIIVRGFAHEKSFAPDGKNILQTLTYCNEKAAKRFIEMRERRRETYETLKRNIANAAIGALEEKFPELRGHLSCVDVWTPATYRRFVASKTGAYMSFAISSHVIPNSTGNRISGLKNVVLATQWQHVTGGLPVAAQNGMDAVAVIDKLERKKKHAPSGSAEKNKTIVVRRKQQQRV